MIGALATFDDTTTSWLLAALTEQHERLAQLNKPKRSLTARNYDSSLRALLGYMEIMGESMPTRSVLENWRDDMLDGSILSDRGTPYALKTINARLAAVRKLLRAVAADAMDLHVKLVLEDWARVADAKSTSIQDYVESDYGIRLEHDDLRNYINAPDAQTLIGKRDRALLALLGLAGLRVSEACALRMEDLSVQNERGQWGIHIRRGKHNKSRVVVIGSREAQLYQIVDAFTSTMALGKSDPVVLALQPAGGGYVPVGALSVRRAQQIVQQYPAFYNGEWITISAHDLRRTYAKLCRMAKMEWDALRLNLGHSSVRTTEDYVGSDVDWSERVPMWSI